ncbi:hypothetical protein SCUCBS95973_007480 [Sporothrix curviconia]|uniref:WW domain-containing protein n=1 Tax=Sporothrix curviconia TaxID=1260050 RepID=A0ABP0CGC9_9PEZI
MASSPETRPDGATDTAPVENRDEASKPVVTEESTSSPDATSATKTDEAAAELPATSEAAEAIDEKPEADTSKASNESLVPQDGANGDASSTLPPLPNEPLPDADNVNSEDADASAPPPLPDEPLPDEKNANDDGWDPVWSDEHQAWYFVNRFTQQTQWENPRVLEAEAETSTGAGAGATVGGYNPAIHGDYDPTAWYATGGRAANNDDSSTTAADNDNATDPIAAAAAAAAAIIQGDSRRGGGSAATNRYNHDAKAGRQLNSYFDVAAASSAHDGRSLKAERSGIKPSKSELKAFKEKRRARKEEKRRAWLRD